MIFRLLTLSGIKYNDEASEVVLKTASGDIGVLPHHEALTSIVLAGPVIVTKISGNFDTFVTFGGILEVDGDVCVLLADEAEHSDELIEHEIEDALAKAKIMQAGAKDKYELAHAQSLVDRHSVRLNVARIKRRHYHN
jgi:F-type H+-transporting ATPase subunit epsilon